MRKAFIYKRGNKLWLCWHDATGKRHQEPSGLEVGEEKLAKEALRRIVARVEAGAKLDEATEGPVTVARYERQWTAERKVQGVITATDESSRLCRHVMPILGSTKLEELRPRHIRDLVRHLRANTDLAPRTIRHIYGALHTMLHNAVVDELLVANPCVLKRHDLPKIVDKDPTWRAQAVFTRGELEQIVSDERIPEDRRVLYALLGLAGLRFGEAAALRWRSYNSVLEPLGQLVVAASYNTNLQREKATKTEQPRLVPVHPTLASVLATWKLGGWAAMVGRAPSLDDLLIPSRLGVNRSHGHGLKKFHADLDRLGLRRRRQHDLRRTFISLTRADGARKDILETVTHGARGDIIDAYTTLPWPSVCEEVAKLKVELIQSKVIEMPRLAVVGG